MELKDHYATYKGSFVDTYLDGYEDYASNIPVDTMGGEPLASYLAMLTTMMEYSASQNDLVGYYNVVTKHQALSLSLFEEMVHKIVGERPTAEDYFNLSRTHGWNYFKYSRCPGLKVNIEGLPEIEVVPRYSSPYIKMEYGENYFDAQEAEYLQSHPYSKAIAETFFYKKPSYEKGIYKILPDTSEEPIPLGKCSSTTMLDWTLPINFVELDMARSQA